MKQFILFYFLFFFSLTAYTQTTYPSGVTGNIARWNFTNSGTVTSLPDVSSNGNNGSTLTNLTAANGFRLLINKAVHFNGSSSYAIVPHKSMLSPSQITIVALVRPTGFYSGNCQGNNIIYKCYDYYTKSGCWAMFIGDNDGNCGTFSPNMEVLEFAGPSVPTYSLTSPPYISANSWYFLVISYDGSQIKRYQVPMDTLTYYSTISPISTSTLGTALGSNTYDVRIGNTQNPPFPYWFNGDMDEIALFNKVLTTTEIQSIYHYLWGQLDISVADTVFCPNDTLDVNYTFYNPDLFQSGNIFKAELSDASGSFTSPTIIGSLISTNMTGTIKCTIPSLSSPGNGFRIRVEATNAHFISGDNGKNIRINPPAKPVAASNTPVCSGNTLSLTSSTTTAGVSYSWTGPNSFSSSTQNPSVSNVQASASGNYIVTVTLGPCSSRDTETVVVNQTPAKPVAASNTPICSGNTLSLTASSSTSGVSYSWTGPNSFSSSVQNPSITNVPVNASGNYIVTVNSNGCSARDTETVVVNLTPVKPTTTASTPICSGNTLTLAAITTTAGVSYSWTGPNSFTFNGQGTSITNAQVNASGNYIVTVTLGPCSSADTVTVVVNQTPAKPVATSNTPVCSGYTLNLSATTTTPGVSYSWGGPNSFSATTQNASITNPPLAASGNYIVAVVLNGCGALDTETVVINQSPAKPAATSNSPVCTGGTLTLGAASATSGVSYSWTGPNGFSSSVQNPTITNVSAPAAGKYIVIAALGPCTASDTTNVSIVPPVVPPTARSNSPICERDSLFLTANSTVPGATYSWWGPNGFSSLAQNPVIANASLAAAGVYYVSAVLSGCPSAPTATTVVIKAPPAIPTASSNSPVCEGDTLFLFAGGTLPGVTFKWYGPGGFTATYANPVIPHVTLSQGGLYTLSAIKNACASLPDSILVVIKPLNKSSFQLNDNACIGVPTELRPYYDLPTLSSYSWFFDGPSTLDSTIYQTYYLSWNTKGKKIVRLTVVANNGCVSIPYEHIIDVHENPDAGIEYVSSKDICTNDDVLLRATPNDSFTYTWAPEGYFAANHTSEIHATVPHSGYIFLSTRNQWDCITNDSVLINARNCCIVSLPDAFTPNGDGRNDKFHIITNGHQDISKFIVVNRWGQVVFETTDQSIGWDGTFKGIPVEVGTYYYYLRYNCNDQEGIERKGDFTLIR